MVAAALLILTAGCKIDPNAPFVPGPQSPAGTQRGPSVIDLPIQGEHSGPVNRIEALPEHVRPGRHTVTLPVGQDFYYSWGRAWDCGNDWAPGKKFWPNGVGWGQLEGPNDHCGAFVVQRVVFFNTSLLDMISDKQIERAVLSYDEQPFPLCFLATQLGVPIGPYGCWLDGDAQPEPKPNGCVDVRIPALDVRSTQPGSQDVIPTADDGGAIVRILGTTTWDVSQPFNYQLVGAPFGLVPRHGFLLSGWPRTLDQLTGDDDTRCVSEVTNVRLSVTYSVPSTGRFIPPN